MPDERCDIAVIGAGMAGASLAAAIGARANVLLLEAEAQPGYHATGRSAAFWTESYGGPAIQPLTTASGPELRRLGVLTPRGALTLARAGDEQGIAEFARRFAALGVRTELLGRVEIADRVPGLRAEWAQGAWEPDCCDIDVARLHQHYLAQARATGCGLLCRSALVSAERMGSGWRLTLGDGRSVDAALLVNAAGAWADDVARMAGVRPLGILPLRRTMVQLRTEPAVPPELPLVLDFRETFYFKPEGGKVWLSPHDETPSPPCDTAPEEIDVALAVERLHGAVDWAVERIEHKWAGLRSFAPDRLPVYGFDARVPNYFWCAGQGGFGIQTAPAAADLAVRLLLGKEPGVVDPEPYLPGRLDQCA